MFKAIRIDRNNNKIEIEESNLQYKSLGGRSLIAQFLNDEVIPACDPLGAASKIIFCTSLFAGSGLACANRLSVGAKSPLTGGIKESNVGGTAAAAFASHGIRSLIIEDIPENKEDFVTILIKSDGSVYLEDATNFIGINNYEYVENMQKIYGDNVSVISIGVAGERLYKNSSIQVTEFGTNYPCRAAGRGGLGSVLGSKGVKGIVIQKPDKKNSLDISDKEKFLIQRKELNQLLIESSESNPFSNVGTASTIDFVGPAGIIPTHNFTGTISKEIENLKSDKFMAFVSKNKQPCQAGCLVKCSNIINDKNGNFLTGGFEYETIALCGPNCDIYDYESIAYMDRMCDDLGLDTIETGATMGVCMEAGIIPWGDVNATMKLYQHIADGTELGNLLGQGADRVGKHYCVERIPTCKGQAMPGYDPRGTIGTGYTYATTPMGADHTAGITLGEEESNNVEDAIEHSKMMQEIFAVADSTMCMMAMATFAGHLDKLASLYNAIYGDTILPQDFLELAKKTIHLENEFNRKAGWKPTDNIIPDFFRNEPLPSTGRTFDISQQLLEK
ncbi:aldehyde ferredoxin oxidoreductase C-terminal domain-containing protein [Alkalibacter mobilis]|uniref:aldehyde ferredoxin oxidoreductase C-terminal domain-containing protein n=1 Tax=Alkalibacter mobilis TaxID=2787712 RepID=UPI00189CFBE9|nr:aldehyde ferredoxin oxidoreductase C-terminal domain-containing protein [Alkalibacter mobilis]MBF7095626.1 aldehyde ferredoxin oxidoreductase [Alkalibacter mobilis]